MYHCFIYNKPNNCPFQSAQRSERQEAQASMKIGQLENQRDVLNSELKLKERGLSAWRHKESEYQQQIDQLTSRMDLMSSMLRTRDSELQKFKAKEARYKEKLGFLTNQVEEGSRTKKGLMEPLQLNGIRPSYSLRSPTKTPKHLPALLPNSFNLTDRPRARKNTELPPLRPGMPKSQTLKNGMVLDFNAQGLKLDGGRDSSGLATSRRAPISLTLNTEVAAAVGQGSASAQRSPDSAKGSSDEDTPLPCVMQEKRIDRKGGDIEMDRVALHVPPNSVPMSVLFSVTDTMHYEARLSQIKSAGLHEYIQPCMQVSVLFFSFFFFFLQFQYHTNSVPFISFKQNFHILQ